MAQIAEYALTTGKKDIGKIDLPKIRMFTGEAPSPRGIDL